MKRVYVNEDWCLGCHLCEYNCAFANSGEKDMALALKGKPIRSRIRVEGDGSITYAVSCRHCRDPLCLRIDHAKCVGCLTCVLVCPYGAVLPGPDGAAMKCELCLQNACGEPACAAGCPNRALVYEEREEAEA